MKLPEKHTFFVDRCLGKKIPAALRKAGCLVEVHDDYFPEDCVDFVWLPEVARRGWVILTKDRKIRYRALEFDALINSGARTFVLTSGNLTADEASQILVKAIPRMEKLLEKRKGPFIASVTRGGSVNLVAPAK